MLSMAVAFLVDTKQNGHFPMHTKHDEAGSRRESL